MDAMTDLGWLNAGGETAKAIDVAIAMCRVAGHKSKDVDHSHYRGTDHQVRCDECGYVYHYDSGD